MTPLKVADKIHYVNNQHKYLYRIYIKVDTRVYYYVPILDRDFEGSIEINKNHTNDLLLPTNILYYLSIFLHRIGHRMISGYNIYM